MGYLLALQCGFRFRDFLLGDVDKNATQLLRGAAITMHTSANANPTRFLIRQNNANVVNGRVPSIPGIPKRRHGDAAILWMDCREDGIARKWDIGGKAE